MCTGIHYQPDSEQIITTPKGFAYTISIVNDSGLATFTPNGFAAMQTVIFKLCNTPKQLNTSHLLQFWKCYYNAYMFLFLLF